MHQNASLISASQSLSQAVAVAANGINLLAGLHENMLTEVRNVLEQNALLQSELADQKARAEKAEAQLAEAEAALKRMNHEPRKEEVDHA